MQSLTLRTITIASAGLLIFEIIKGSYIIRLNTSSDVDLIIIIVAMAGLFLGICSYETQTSDSASPDAVTASVATTVNAESNEGD